MFCYRFGKVVQLDCADDEVGMIVQKEYAMTSRCKYEDKECVSIKELTENNGISNVFALFNLTKK